MITTLERIIKSRKDRGLRDLTGEEQHNILSSGIYEESYYLEQQPEASGSGRGRE